MNADAFSSIAESSGILPGHKDPGKIITAREALDIFYKDDHLARAELGNGAVGKIKPNPLNEPHPAQVQGVGADVLKLDILKLPTLERAACRWWSGVVHDLGNPQGHIRIENRLSQRPPGQIGRTNP